MNYGEVTKDILQYVGGKENVIFAAHCVTRLRLTLKDRTKVGTNKIEGIEGVLGVVDGDAQYQVIIGQEVDNVCNAFIELTGELKESESTPKANEKKEIWWSRLLDTLAGISTPIMSIIAGAGILKALLSILTLFNWIGIEGNTYYFLTFIVDASYHFLPIFLVSSVVEKFHTNNYMTMLMGVILLHPSFPALPETGDYVSVLGLPIKIVTYSSSIISIILITFVLSYVEKWVNKITPATIKFIARPILTILIMTSLALAALGSPGSLVGDGLVNGLLAVEEITPWIMSTIIGAFMPFLIMTRMRYDLLPTYVGSLLSPGYGTIIDPGNLPSDTAQGAAALCVALETKNRKFKQLAVSGGITALLGITEPAFFGVNLKLRKPLIAATIDGGLGGLHAGLTGVMHLNKGGTGLTTLGLYIGDDPTNLIDAIISAAIAFVVTFVILWKIGFEDSIEVPNEN